MAWIDQKREAKELVTVHMVHVRAHELNPAAHTRSSGWWKRFRQHNGVHLKMPQYEKMTRIRTEQELADLIVAYWRRLHWYRLQGRVAYNMDETRVIYESHNARTVCRLGDRNVFVKCAGKEKDGFTVMLSVNEFGQKLPPVLIFKGVKPISLFVSKSVQQPPIVLLNGKNTWLNEASMLTWMHWFVTTLGRCAGAPTAHANAHAHADADADADADAPKATTDTYNEHSMTGHVVLVMDRLATHWTGRVSEAAAALQLATVSVPPNCTMHVQPVDQGILLSFKQRLRSVLTQFAALKGGASSLLSFKPLQWKQAMLEMVCRCWDAVETQTVRHAWTRTGTGVALDGSQNELVQVSLFQSNANKAITPDFTQPADAKELMPTHAHASASASLWTSSSRSASKSASSVSASASAGASASASASVSASASASLADQIAEAVVTMEKAADDAKVPVRVVQPKLAHETLKELLACADSKSTTSQSKPKLKPELAGTENKESKKRAAPASDAHVDPDDSVLLMSKFKRHKNSAAGSASASASSAASSAKESMPAPSPSSSKSNKLAAARSTPRAVLPGTFRVDSLVDWRECQCDDCQTEDTNDKEHEPEFLVKWVGYAEPTWEPRSHLEDAGLEPEIEDLLHGKR
jgi:hypothetical protein